MSGQGRTAGLILIVVGVAIDLAIVLWGVAGLVEDRLRPTGFALLIVVSSLVVLLPFVGGGIFLLRRGRVEKTEMERLQKEQRLVGMIEAQGTVSIAHAAASLGVSRDEVQSLLYDLVGKNLFTGYIDWKAGKLVAQDAVNIQSTVANGHCPNCGGQVEMAGKGTIGCPYCGAEIFLSVAPSVVGGQA